MPIRGVEMKENIVKHKGVVQQVGDSRLTVRILQTSGCSSCSIKAHCTSAESKEHLIEVEDMNASRYHAGEEVWITGSTAMGRQAVWYGYVLPLFIIVGLLFVLSFWLKDQGELTIGLCTLICFIPYYFLLYYFGKDKMKKKFSFTVMPLDDNFTE